MSEETPSAKKAAKKSVRKKSATKRSPRKNTKTDNPDEQLPLDESLDKAKEENSPTPPQGESESSPRKRPPREPRSGVRDARRDTSDEPLENEISEKLVDSETLPKEEKSAKVGEQNRPEQNEGRGRGRNRGRGRGQERAEKREPKPRIVLDQKDLSKKAWKIFESEVTEEGLALLDDNGLRDYARSSFNAARLFLEEENRVAGRQEKVKKAKPDKSGKPDKSDKPEEGEA